MCVNPNQTVNPHEFPQRSQICQVSIQNVAALSPEEFTKSRRNGIGASDSAVLLGLMAMYNKDEHSLRISKLAEGILEEEEAIGKKESVRKGRDLEELILKKFGELWGCDTPYKPINSYALTDLPFLTVNFDGVISENDFDIPVECKFVTPRGDKYYSRPRAILREFPTDTKIERTPIIYTQGNITDYCIAKAKDVGVPSYYYVQVQHQMMMLGSPYGYLAALHDKNWELCIYKMPRDDEVINQIKVLGYKFWNTLAK